GGIAGEEPSRVAGALRLVPAAAMGAPGPRALCEPIHGSAPDIAGKGIANPLAAILSFEMALRSSLGRADLADRLFAAVNKALEGGARTPDIGGKLTTEEMGRAVIAAL